MSKVVTCRCVQVSAKKFFCSKIVEKSVKIFYDEKKYSNVIIFFLCSIFPIRPEGKKLKILIFFRHRLEEKIVHLELLFSFFVEMRRDIMCCKHFKIISLLVNRAVFFQLTRKKRTSVRMGFDFFSLTRD